MKDGRDLGEILEEYLVDGKKADGVDPVLLRVVDTLKADWNAELDLSVPIVGSPIVRRGRAIGPTSIVRGLFGSRDLQGGRMAAPLQTILLATIAFVSITFITVKYLSTKTSQPKTYTTAPGQRATITLADGSQAILAPATTLHVQGRNIELDGEALFTVTSHTNIPFTVTTGKSTTKVLGTTFSVRAYKDEPEIHVAVAEGRVMINNSVLANGDLASVSIDGNVNVVHDAERVADMLAFAHGRLVIAVQPLAQAAPEIARWYGLNITVDSSAANQHIGITLQSQSATEALAMIAELTHTRYRVNGVDGRSVTFTR